MLRRRAASVLTAMMFAACGGGVSPTAPPPSAPRPARMLTGITVESDRGALRVGQQASLIAYGAFDDGTTGTVSAVYESSDPSVAEVDDDGALVGRSPGTAVISGAFEGHSDSFDLTVSEPNERVFVDRPDDITGPQIHVVYALPSDAEAMDLDLNLDRWGDIEVAFEAIQNWLNANLGTGLRLDTYQGRLDVTYLSMSITHQEADGLGGGLIGQLQDELRALGPRGDKIYAVYYVGRAIGVNGSAFFGGPGAVYVRPSLVTRVGMDPEVPSLHEVVMVHELFHAFRAVPDCAPSQGNGAHVTDEPTDVMFAGVERAPRGGAETLFDAGADDYLGHGRPDCLDIADSPYWERRPVHGAGSAGAALFSGPLVPDLPPGSWPIRCEVRN